MARQMENIMDNKFKLGDLVCFKSSPYIPKLTIEAINPDGTYKCFWIERVPKLKTKRDNFDGMLLQVYISPVSVTILRNKY